MALSRSSSWMALQPRLVSRWSMRDAPGLVEPTGSLEAAMSDGIGPLLTDAIGSVVRAHRRVDYGRRARLDALSSRLLRPRTRQARIERAYRDLALDLEAIWPKTPQSFMDYLVRQYLRQYSLRGVLWKPDQVTEYGPSPFERMRIDPEISRALSPARRVLAEIDHRESVAEYRRFAAQIGLTVTS